MKQNVLTASVKSVLAIALSLVLVCTTVIVAPQGHAEEALDLHKYQTLEYAVPNAEMVFSLRKPSMFDGYKYYYTPVAEERDMYVSLGWEYVGEVDAAEKPWHLVHNPNIEIIESSFHVTADDGEYQTLLSIGWEDRGFRYGARDDSSKVPVYRVYDPNSGFRYYTRDITERDYLLNDGWSDEGVSGYSGPETEEDLAVILEELNPSKPSEPAKPFQPGITVRGDTGIRAEGNLQGPNVPSNAAIEIMTGIEDSSSAYYYGLDQAIGERRIGDVYSVGMRVNGQSVSNGFGELTISPPIDAKYNGHLIVVHHHRGGDGIEKIRSVARDGYVSLTVTSLSAFAMEDTGIEAQTMYRLYNPNSGEHFYTASEFERDSVVASGWNDEGVGWIAPKTSSKPVYRLYSGTDHHYTMSAFERDELVKAGWRIEGDNPEGIAWYSDDAETVPLYRQFNPNVDPSAPTNNSGSHNYTTSLDEHNSLVSIGWQDENVGWYAVAKG